jgi:hypothetical protein
MRSDELQGRGGILLNDELVTDLRRELLELDKAILTLELPVNKVMHAVDPSLTDYMKYDPDLPWDLP